MIKRIKKRQLLLVMMNKQRYQNYQKNRNHRGKKPHTINIKKEDYNVVLKELQDYMLTNDKLVSSKQIIDQRFFDRKKHRKENKKIVKPKNAENEIFFPKQKDTLFWCFYIMYKSREDYDMIINKHFQIEKTLKIDIVDHVRDKKDCLKQQKIKRVDMESELVNDNKISLITFIGMSYIYDMNVIVVKDKVYYEITNDETKNYNVITYKNDGVNTVYGIEENVDGNCVEKYREKLYKITDISKPIRGISYYKIADLTEICSKLGIPVEDDVSGKKKKKNKNRLYEEIVQNVYF